MQIHFLYNMDDGVLSMWESSGRGDEEKTSVSDYYHDRNEY